MGLEFSQQSHSHLRVSRLAAFHWQKKTDSQSRRLPPPTTCASHLFEDSIRDDAVARVLGHERHERIQGLGFRVVPSKVDGQIQSYGRARELESQLQTQSEMVVALEEKVKSLLKLSQQNLEDGNSNGFTPQSHQ